MKARKLSRFFLISILVSISLSLILPRAEAWQAVTAATYHTCGLRNDGTLACWGRNTYGIATPPNGKQAQFCSQVPLVDEDKLRVANVCATVA